jgi:hypothetical protein
VVLVGSIRLNGLAGTSASGADRRSADGRESALGRQLQSEQQQKDLSQTRVAMAELNV